MRGPLLTALVPVFNEAATLDKLLGKLADCPVVGEVVAVDDGSTDASAALLSKWRDGCPRSRIVRTHPTRKGKGCAIATALGAATGSYVIIQDADLEYDPRDIISLVQLMEREAPVAVYGSRFGAGSDARFSYSMHRLANQFLTAATNLASGGRLKLGDMATCYKLLRRDTITAFDLKEHGFGFDPEITLKIAAGRGDILEYPIRYRGRSSEEGKKLNFTHGLEYLRCIFAYRVSGWGKTG